MQISVELDVQYKTAWFMLHRVREACDDGMFALTDVVEVDETYVGGKEHNKHQFEKLNEGRGTVGKVSVDGAPQWDGKVSAKSVEHVDRRTMVGFIESRAEPGTITYIDEAAAVHALSTIFSLYQHETVNHGSGEFVRGKVHTNSIESEWSVFKRSLTGTSHHVSRRHLDRYVNEATFRLNEGNCEVDTIDRMAVLARAIGGKRLRYRDLVA